MLLIASYSAGARYPRTDLALYGVNTSLKSVIHVQCNCISSISYILTLTLDLHPFDFAGYLLTINSRGVSYVN